jgi:hypothetical protein
MTADAQTDLPVLCPCLVQELDVIGKIVRAPSHTRAAELM